MSLKDIQKEVSEWSRLCGDRGKLFTLVDLARENLDSLEEDLKSRRKTSIDEVGEDISYILFDLVRIANYRNIDLDNYVSGLITRMYGVGIKI